jgi:hypothetical protein
MSDKTLTMTFLNEIGSRASISLPAVKDDLTAAEVSTAMDVVIAKDIFNSTGGNLITKHSAQITDRTVSELVVR